MSFFAGFVTGAMFVILGILALCAVIASEDEDHDDNQRGAG